MRYRKQPREQDLIEMLQQMRAVPPRQPGDAARGRAQFLAQIDAEQRARCRSGFTLGTRGAGYCALIRRPMPAP